MIHPTPIAAVRFETERLIVRTFVSGDARLMSDFYRRNDDRFRRWDPPRPEGFFTEEFWSGRLEEAIEERRLGIALRLVFEPKVSTERLPIAGFASFTQIFRGPFLSCMLGYGADGAHEGQGLMREGLEASIGHVFDVLGLHRVQASYGPTNERSGLLLRRLGFDVEGYARDYLFIDGAWRDSIVTARRSPNP